MAINSSPVVRRSLIRLLLEYVSGFPYMTPTILLILWSPMPKMYVVWFANFGWTLPSPPDGKCGRQIWKPSLHFSRDQTFTPRKVLTFGRKSLSRSLVTNYATFRSSAAPERNRAESGVWCFYDLSCPVLPFTFRARAKNLSYPPWAREYKPSYVLLMTIVSFIQCTPDVGYSVSLYNCSKIHLQVGLLYIGSLLLTAYPFCIAKNLSYIRDGRRSV